MCEMAKAVKPSDSLHLSIGGSDRRLDEEGLGGIKPPRIKKGSICSLKQFVDEFFSFSLSSNFSPLIC